MLPLMIPLNLKATRSYVPVTRRRMLSSRAKWNNSWILHIITTTRQKSGVRSISSIRRRRKQESPAYCSCTFPCPTSLGTTLPNLARQDHLPLGCSAWQRHELATAGNLKRSYCSILCQPLFVTDQLLKCSSCFVILSQNHKSCPDSRAPMWCPVRASFGNVQRVAKPIKLSTDQPLWAPCLVCENKAERISLQKSIYLKNGSNHNISVSSSLDVTWRQGGM